MTTFTKKRSLLQAIGSSLGLTSALCMVNGANADSFELEEIIVTAQKRAQSLQDVPISVSAVSGDKMAEAGIQRFEDVAAYVPNFQITKGTIGDKINIRGIQSGTQAGFEQSVGTFVDGVYRGRGVQVRNAFLDVDMVEVLRGPQGTLFGKNTIAGALNVTTRKPTEEFEAELTATHNLDFDETTLQGVISGSLTDDLRGRLVVMSREMDEGWIDNAFYNDDTPMVDETAVRGTLEWDVTNETLVTLRVEEGDFENSPSLSIAKAGPLVAFGAVESFDKYNAGNSGPVMDFGSHAEMDGDNREVSLTVESEFEAGTLTAIVGYSEYEFTRFTDVDYSAVNGLRFDDAEEFDQTSLEVRFASALGDNFDYITGLFYQNQNLKAEGTSYFNLPVLQGILNGGCAAALGAGYGAVYVAGDPVTTAVNAAASGSAALTNTCAQAAAFDGVADGVSRYADLNQDTESWAIFAQGNWTLSEDLNLTLGIRYTEEEKEASQGVNAIDFVAGNKVASSNPLVIGLSQAVGEFTTHNFTSDDPGMTRDEESLTWSVNLQWDITPDAMLYAGASTGFKAGGYNSFYMGMAQGAGADSNDVDFEEEEVITFEVGSKMTLLDGQAELNVAVFRTEYDDMQAAIFSGGTTFVVRNAAKATTQGIEIDGRWRATENLTVHGSFGWIDFEFEDFANQACTSDQLVTARQAAFDAASTNLGKALAALGYNNASCSAAGINDMEGERAANAPEFSATLGFNHVNQIGDFDISSNLDFEYLDEVNRQEDLDPVGLDDERVKVNASVTFGPVDGNWDISLIGRNLTNEETFGLAGDVPLFAGAHVQMVDQPRNISVRGRLHF